ncbi:juvenile hormone acid O-methyltransferase-like [Ixodes scapularis]|uniref:juvenile hormone acid O-methyltransferase-like n=1 Tax=Ixodes scapularis TaxID=6945 RepID=UPI001A9EF893|nr:juvenile hormone acid O-methyltransferase-like [Ixodes scapularis]
MSTDSNTALSTLNPELYNDATAKAWFSFGVDGLEAMNGAYGMDAKDDKQFIDLGCGPGDIARDGLLPRCLLCRRIVAVDLSRDMVEFANTHYGHPKIIYDVLDIVADEVADFAVRYGRFDRVYSFFCFNWVKDQEKAFKNMAELMKPGAERLLWFFASSPHIRFRQMLVEMEPWKKYAKVAERCIPPTINMNGKDEIASYISSLLKSANLTPSICNVTQEALVNYDSAETITLELMAMNPLTNLMTEEEKSDLLKEATKEASKLWHEQETKGPPIMFDVVAVCAFKPEP